jgi:hypothetical protein
MIIPDLGAIGTALGQALASVPGVDRVAWPNRTGDPARPFVLFDHVPTLWENATVDGSETRASGYFDAAVCIEAGGFTRSAETLAQAIIAAFPPGRRLGGVCIVNSGHLRGYFDGVGWRQVARIEYRSET